MSGYNEDAYRQAREAAIACQCPFERALLSRCVSCGQARKLLLAEREAISCTDAALADRCRAFHAELHEKARFALHIEAGQPWPFGKEIRAQCGGILGLRECLAEQTELTPEADVAQLLDTASLRGFCIETLPYSCIMRAVAHFEPRKRRH
jgi:hypothetical protein